MELFRLIAVCALIFMSCTGLGVAGFWVVTRTEEPITLREIRMVVRGMGVSTLSAWLLMLVAPANALWTAGVALISYTFVVTVLLTAVHRKINKSRRKAEDPYE